MKCDSITSFFSSFDIMGSEYMFKSKSRNSYKTILGGSLSMLLFGWYIYIFVDLLYDSIGGGNYQLSYTTHTKFINEIDFSQIKYAMTMNCIYLKDDLIINQEAYNYLEIKTEMVFNTAQWTKKYETKTSVCTPELLAKGGVHPFHYKRFLGCLCTIPDHKAANKISNFWIEEYNSYFSISVSLKPDIDTKNSTNFDDIINFFSQKTPRFVSYYFENSFNTTNDEEPVNSNLDKVESHLVPYYQKLTNVFLKPIKYEIIKMFLEKFLQKTGLYYYGFQKDYEETSLIPLEKTKELENWRNPMLVISVRVSNKLDKTKKESINGEKFFGILHHQTWWLFLIYNVVMILYNSISKDLYLISKIFKNKALNSYLIDNFYKLQHDFKKTNALKIKPPLITKQLQKEIDIQKEKSYKKIGGAYKANPDEIISSRMDDSKLNLKYDNNKDNPMIEMKRISIQINNERKVKIDDKEKDKDKKKDKDNNHDQKEASEVKIIKLEIDNHFPDVFKEDNYNIEVQQKESSISANYRIIKNFWEFVCCKPNTNDTDDVIRDHINTKNALAIYNYYSDVTIYMQKMMEIDVIKYVLFNRDEREMISLISGSECFLRADSILPKILHDKYDQEKLAADDPKTLIHLTKLVESARQNSGQSDKSVKILKLIKNGLKKAVIREDYRL